MGKLLNENNSHSRIYRLEYDQFLQNGSDQSEIMEYSIDAVLEFDSVRKRMSIMAKHPDGTYHIHSKGAESSIFEVSNLSTGDLKQLASKYVTQFAINGLRTLVYASRQVDSKEYYQLLDEFYHANSLFGSERNDALKKIYSKIEYNLTLVSITGVEDKLQPGVHECLKNLRDAGIQVWVLTGDKEETAITVSRSAGHFTPNMNLVHLTNYRPRYRHSKRPGSSGEPMALVIDGKSLRYALDPTLRKTFLNLCLHLTTVLCCRLTPLQKASVVQLVRSGFSEFGVTPITAAIGDGGNDVAMLLQANIGIGVYGKEGKEAVRASDYAIPQFKHLQRLLLVHGHQANYRICITMNLFYYKCVTFVTTQVLYTFYSGFSAVSTFETVLFSIYNLTVTSLMCMLFGIFERHLPDDILNANPYLYRRLKHQANLRSWYVCLWILDGIWHGTIIFYGATYFFTGGYYFSEGTFYDPRGNIQQLFDMSLYGCATYLFVWFSVSLRIFIASHDYTIVVFGGILTTLTVNIAILIALQSTTTLNNINFRSYTKLCRCPTFWFALPLILTIANLPSLLWRIISDAWWNLQIHLSSIPNKQIRRKYRRSPMVWFLALTTNYLTDSYDIFHRSEIRQDRTWLPQNCDESFDSHDDNDAENSSNVSRKVNNDSPSTMALSSDIIVQHEHISTEISSVIRELGEEQEKSNRNEHENVVTVTEQKSDDADKIVQCQKLWSRSELRNAVRLHDIDIVPKILYSHSPVVTALQRADVTRYLEFRFVSRLLAYIGNNECTQQSGTVSNDADNQSSSTNCMGRVVKIPVCRSDVFKTRLLSLHQKRSLGAFFEWCFHLIINDTQGSTTHSEKDEDYCAYEDRPFQDLLTEKRKLDKFTQQLLITNLSFSNQQIKTKEAIFRIRRLLFSMGRFGPYPILWPMYGSGDLTQGYCRMSAVFGTTFCLGCKVKKIQYINSEVDAVTQSVENMSTNMKDEQITTETDPSSSSPSSSKFASIPKNNTDDDFIVYLSNGRKIRTKCVILCPECLPYSWISDFINHWCARAVLITDSSLLPDDCKSSDISILAYSFNANNQQNDLCLDPVILIECQVEKNKFCKDN
ncbi:putative atpase, class VI, type 11c, partial [Schistosoma mansoni]|uniref:putative atpase, class VI, type 11c n=1 Tax=Schistosoma mansoni TaxID=6183 RepID=UPI00022DC01E